MDQDSKREPGGEQPGSPRPTDPLDPPEQPAPGDLTVGPETAGEPPGYPLSASTHAQASPQHPQHPQYPQSIYPQQPTSEGAGTVQYGQPGQAGQYALPEQPHSAGEPTRTMPPPGPPPAYTPPYPALPQTRRSGWPAWAWVVMGLGVLTCLGCVAIGVLGGNVIGQFAKLIGEPAAVANDYWLALQTHDFEKAHSYFSDDLAREYSPEELEVDWRALEERGEITGSAYERINVENDRATLAWVVTAGGEKYATTLRLRNTGGEWKITGGDPGVVPQP